MATAHPPILRVIVSGGQTGVDQAAHRAAEACGILRVGWCPPGRVFDGGTIPLDWPLVETPTDTSSLAPDVPRSLRTEWNVRDSQGTLILLADSIDAEPGTAWTRQAAAIYHRPILVITLTRTPVEQQPDRESRDVAAAVDWATQHAIFVLNVAGPSERASPGIADRSYNFLMRLFAAAARPLPSRPLIDLVARRCRGMEFLW